MHFNFIQPLITLLFTSIVADKYKDYIIWHPQGAMTDYLNQFAPGHETVPFTDGSEITYASLTENLATNINATLIKTNAGIVALNEKHQYVDSSPITTAEYENDGSTSTADMPQAAATKYINSPPHCKCNVDKVRFIIFDTLINTKLNVFKGVEIHAIFPPNSGIDPQTYGSHGAEVLSVALGTNYGVATGKGRNVTNIVIANSWGTAIDQNIINGFRIGKDLADQNSKEGFKTIGIFSYGGSYRSDVKTAAARLFATANQDTMAFFSVSNNNQLDWCSISYWTIAEAFISGASAYPGNKLSTYGNVGACVDAYPPGRFQSFNGKIIFGASFSNPISAGISACLWNKFPQYSRQQVVDAYYARTDVVQDTTTQGIVENMHVIRRDKACLYI
jgi:hypothetical protein